MRIIVTGTPGTGKTTLAKKLSKRLRLRYINVTNLIKTRKFYDFYDKDRECYVISESKLKKHLDGLLKRYQNIIIDSHLSQIVNPKLVDHCVITRAKIETIHKRLSKRKYSKEKIKENIEAEIFEICLEESSKFQNKIIIDTTKPYQTKDIIARLK